MADVRVAIAAAGAGTRAGLPYPKTLHPVLGTPILVRQLELLRTVDPCPAVVVSPQGREPIEACLAEHRLAADLVVQESPTGMGDAILCLAGTAQAAAGHLLLLWGDIPLLCPATVRGMLDAHLSGEHDFTFATRVVDRAYTVVVRDEGGRVVDLQETRERGTEPGPGERDIGLFVFRPAPVLALLERRLEGAFGRRTGEHGFLYLVRHLAAQGLEVHAVPIATEQDLISLNSLSDVDEATLRASLDSPPG